LPLRPDLENQAREFAHTLTDLLNRTICDGIRLKSVIQDDGELGWVGYRISRRIPFPGEAIPVSIGRRPNCYLHVMQTLELDEEGSFLRIQTSSYGLYLDAALDHVLFHYDYDRDPPNNYPMAHIQVEGASESLERLAENLGIELSLGRLHFPVGGKRYRPSVEDIVEFLIVEGLADGRAGWTDAVEEHRARWYRIQLRSAVRRDSEIAREELQRVGYRVTPPASSP
jgi:hypothetical protein